MVAFLTVAFLTVAFLRAYAEAVGRSREKNSYAGRSWFP